MHVNDPFIFLITDVNHRKPPTPTACTELLVCMRDHMWYGESFTPLHPSVICVPGSPVHIHANAYGAAARPRLQHDTVVSRICYV